MNYFVAKILAIKRWAQTLNNTRIFSNRLFKFHKYIARNSDCILQKHILYTII